MTSFAEVWENWFGSVHFVNFVVSRRLETLGIAVGFTHLLLRCFTLVSAQGEAVHGQTYSPLLHCAHGGRKIFTWHQAKSEAEDWHVN